ncbi:MAG: hypothetical protein AB7S26_36560 [Sandaracinaceae bacterium]
MRRAWLVGLTLLGCCVLPGRASADAWTQAAGDCYLKLAARGIFGSGAYQSTGLRDDRQGIVDYQDVQANLYGECGVHPQLTVLSFMTPFGYANASTSTGYVGPYGIGLRLDPIGDGAPTRFAIQASYSYAPPAGDVILFEEPRASPRVFYRPALENHVGELDVQLGHGFVIDDNVSGWVVGSVGARIQSGEGMDAALVAMAQVGMTFYGWLTAELHVPLYEPFGQPVVETNIAGVGQTRYLGFGFTVSFWMIPELSLVLGLDGVFYASSNAATPSLMLGFQSRWGPDDL